jgi:hypothetical protein
MAVLTRSPVLTLFGSLFLLLFDALATMMFSIWGSIEGLSGSGFARTVSEWTIWANREFYALHGSGRLFADGWAELLGTCLYTGLFFTLAGWLFVRNDVR